MKSAATMDCAQAMWHSYREALICTVGLAAIRMIFAWVIPSPFRFSDLLAHVFIHQPSELVVSRPLTHGEKLANPLLHRL
jgi:hypothetical protein